MLLQKGGLVGENTGQERRVVDREMVGVVVPSDAEGCTTGDQRGICGIHQALPIAYAQQHPAAIPLVLTRRTLSATGFAAADALIAALGRAELPDRDRLAAFHAVLGFVVGAAQAELAGPLTRGRDAADAAARIGSVAGTTYPHIEALSVVAMQTTVEEDFDRGLRMLLDGVATRRSRKRR
jgi:hypothetical protein